MAFPLPISRLAEEKWLEKAAGHTDTAKFFAIETLLGEYIGNCVIHDIESTHRHCELGIVIGQEKYLGQGYGTDTIRLLLKICFHTLNLHKVFLRVFSGNLRAVACYEKCGFWQVGRLKEHRFSEGSWNDEIIMEILRQDYDKNPKEPKTNRQEH